MPEFRHCVCISHKINSRQAQNEALVPSLSKEGCDQRAAESVCNIPITPMSCICLALKYGWLKGWTVSRPFLQYVYFGKTNHYKTKQLPPSKTKKRCRGWSMDECRWSFSTKEQISCCQSVKEENYYSIIMAFTLNKSTVCMNLKCD